MSESYSMEYAVRACDCDCFQRLRTSVLFSLLQEAGIQDVHAAGLTDDTTSGGKRLWVISRAIVEMERFILCNETIRIETSCGKRMHMVIPRYYRILDAEGNIIMNGAALWVVIDADSRMPVSLEDEQMELQSCEQEEGRIELPMGLMPIDKDHPASIRRALFSDIDLNGHMNNTRYLDWIDDLFDMHFHEVTKFSSIQINFIHEVSYEERVSLCYEYREGRYRIDGNAGEETVFSAELKLKRR